MVDVANGIVSTITENINANTVSDVTSIAAKATVAAITSNTATQAVNTAVSDVNKVAEVVAAKYNLPVTVIIFILTVIMSALTWYLVSGDTGMITKVTSLAGTGICWLATVIRVKDTI